MAGPRNVLAFLGLGMLCFGWFYLQPPSAHGVHNATGASKTKTAVWGDRLRSACRGASVRKPSLATENVLENTDWVLQTLIGYFDPFGGGGEKAGWSEHPISVLS